MNKYIVAAAAAIFTVFLAYVLRFYYVLGYSLSDSPEAWALLGDYAGGLLNPLLTFLSLVLLIKSLTLQNEANISLREEREDTRKTERLRSFEAQLFNMIRAHKDAFDSFNLSAPFHRATKGVDTFLKLEIKISSMRGEGQTEEEVETFLESIDKMDQIFSLNRMFYNMLRMISEKLSDANGFSVEDRKSHYITLINFTEFALLRLIMMSAQFLDYHSIQYLKSNSEFNSVLQDLGIGYDLY